MNYRKIVITGGAGFVGSNLALFFKRNFPDLKVLALDNLYRRGSELALSRLKDAGVEFIHGDIRCKEDLAGLGSFDLMIECSAEPSVKAGYGGNPSYLINTNLIGTLNCLEAVRVVKADLLFLSTSRIYPIGKLKELPLKIEGKRFSLKEKGVGWSEKGISSAFSIEGTRSLYGATKLASELILQEYAQMYDLNIVINRCGVISGPWQMGKVDQGFVTLWLARHCLGGSLKYMGFEGKGHQVRDILHVEDLFDLLVLQLTGMNKHAGKIYNVGGGLSHSISLAELTDWCRPRHGELPIESDPASHPSDIPYYITDNTEVENATGWTQKRSLSQTLTDIEDWLLKNQLILKPIFGVV